MTPCTSSSSLVQRFEEATVRFGRLNQIFNSGNPSKFDFQIARLSVLLEDLRVEHGGLSANSLDGLDDAGEPYRRLYFLRRSLATLFEFDQALLQIDAMPQFDEFVRARLSPRNLRFWIQGIHSFQKHRDTLCKLRHNIGGHFAEGASKVAVRAFTKENVGSIKIVFQQGGGAGVVCTFAGEVAAAAFGDLLIYGSTTQSKLTRLMRITNGLYRAAIQNTFCIAEAYLWDQFGS